MKIENFLNTEYSQSALYQSFRSIASYVDGLKPSSRKVIYTLKKRNITHDVKVSRFASDVASETEYLHGETSLQGVIVNMAQNFVGSNNDNLLYPSGSFGTRFIPASSAPRYIFTRKSESFDKYFHKDDDPVLISQEFEGSVIEPRFFVPVLPLILINGSEGIGTGYAQKIFPRSVEEIEGYIKTTLEDKIPRRKLIPNFRGFKGTVIPDEENSNSWYIEGVFSIKNTSSIEITEVPIGYTLSSYTAQLEKLVERRIIKDYEDLSEDDNFLFKISVSREFTKKSKEEITDILKLRKKISENYTCVDEENKIVEMKSAEEILQAFIKIRIEYYAKRKEYLLKKLSEDILLLESRAAFIKAVIEERVLINNKKKSEIETQIKKIENIITVDDSYDYLLRMPIWSLTHERYTELLNQVKEFKGKVKEIKSKSDKTFWLEDLEVNL